MKTTTFFFCIILAGFMYACTPKPKNPGGGMNYFKGNFEQAVAQATTQNKPVFIYGFTTWCGYCKKMAKSTFMEKEVNDYMNSHYINLSYDLEKDEGIYIAGKYGLTSYPAYVLLNSKGEVLAISGGYMNAEKFLGWVKTQPAS
jgi:thioredoxin-related protein